MFGNLITAFGSLFLGAGMGIIPSLIFILILVCLWR